MQKLLLLFRQFLRNEKDRASRSGSCKCVRIVCTAADKDFASFRKSGLLQNFKAGAVAVLSVQAPAVITLQSIVHICRNYLRSSKDIYRSILCAVIPNIRRYILHGSRTHYKKRRLLLYGKVGSSQRIRKVAAAGNDKGIKSASAESALQRIRNFHRRAVAVISVNPLQGNSGDEPRFPESAFRAGSVSAARLCCRCLLLHRPRTERVAVCGSNELKAYIQLRRAYLML